MHEKIDTEFDRLEFPEGWRRYVHRLLMNYQSGLIGLNDDVIDPGIEVLEVLRTFQTVDESALRLTLLSRALARSDSLRVRARCGHTFWDPMTERLNDFQHRHSQDAIVHYVDPTHRHPAPDIVEFLVRDNLRKAMDN